MLIKCIVLAQFVGGYVLLARFWWLTTRIKKDDPVSAEQWADIMHCGIVGLFLYMSAEFTMIVTR